MTADFALFRRIFPAGCFGVLTNPHEDDIIYL